MLAKQIRQNIIAPTLKILDLWSLSAEILIYGTGHIESGYEYLLQIGNPKNGGLGFFQMEPSDFSDILLYLKKPKNRQLSEYIMSSCYYTAIPIDPMTLISNIKFAIAMCRVHYLRAAASLPKPDDANAMANYHMKYYNGDGLGKTDVSKNVPIFQRIIDGNL